MKKSKKITTIASYILSTAFGIGYFPKFPGTIASIAIAILWNAIPEHHFYNISENAMYYDSFVYMAITLAILTIIGIKITTTAEKALGTDAPQIVYDEIVGYLVACLFLPKTLMVAIYALILFRVFDILKPFYIKNIQKLKAGYGIMLDDIAAGIAANIILQILYHIKPQFFI